MTFSPSFASDNRVSVGQEWDTNTPTDFFGGLIDDVRVYNRDLTKHEISQIVNSGTGTEHSDAFSFFSALGAKSSTGAFISQLTDLIQDTIYYIRSYATLFDGSTVYGNEVQFTTPKPPKYRFNPGGYYKFKGNFKFW